MKAANKALQFSGSQYVVAPDSPSLHVTTDLTVEAWVNFAQTVAFECIVCKPFGTQTGDSFAIWYQEGAIYAGAAATSPDYYCISSAEWAARWPSEDLWVASRRGA